MDEVQHYVWDARAAAHQQMNQHPVIWPPVEAFEPGPGEEEDVASGAGAAGAQDHHQQQHVISMDILPPEMLPLIFRFLPIHVRFMIQSVSHRWYEAARFSIRKQAHLIIKPVKFRSKCQSHEMPHSLLARMAHMSCLSSADLLCGLRTVRIWCDLSQMSSLQRHKCASILKASSQTLTLISAPGEVLTLAQGQYDATFPSVRSLEFETNIHSLNKFPAVEKLIIRSLNIHKMGTPPESVTSIQATCCVDDRAVRRLLPIQPVGVGNNTKLFPWLLQLKEIRIPYRFTDVDIRKLLENSELEVLSVAILVNDLQDDTVSRLMRSNLKSLLISDSKLKMNFNTNENGFKFMSITETGSQMRDISSLVQSAFYHTSGFRVTHSLSNGTCEYEMTFWKKGSLLRGMELRSSTWTNEQFKVFIDKLTVTHTCNCLKIEVKTLVPGADLLKLITSRFPSLNQLHITVNKYIAREMDKLLILSDLTDIRVRQFHQNVEPAESSASELEGMAVIEHMAVSPHPISLTEATSHSVLKLFSQSNPSSRRSVLKFDVPEYTADAVFFFTLSTRNPYLERIDLNICNFYGRNLSPLQDLKYLKEVNINFSSKLPLSVEMLGSILSGWKNRELVFSLKTFWERNEVFAEIQDHKLIRLNVSQSMDWESHQSNNWPRLLSEFNSLEELELNGVGCGYNVICHNRRLKNLTWDKLDDLSLISFAKSLPRLECVSCFENADVTTDGLMALLRGKARHCLRRIDVPMPGYQLNTKILMDEVKVIQRETGRKILLFIGE